MEMFKAQLSKHCEFGRINRINEIKANIGLGQIVKEVYVRGFNKIETNQLGVYLCFTDTGVTIVKDEMRQTIITMYVTTINELVKAFNGANNIPKYLNKKVNNNQRKYVKNGKTIWH